MAQTLTTERNLLRRQEEIESEVRFLKRMRILEWTAAAIILAVGLAWRYGNGGGWGIVIFGAFIAFLALGHEFHRRESAEEGEETAEFRAAKASVAALLDEKLANDHYILNDLRLKSGREKCWIDHLVVAPSGLFVIHTLAWGGKIIGDTAKQAHVWKIRDAATGQLRPARNPVGNVLRKRRLLRNWLKGTNLIWERVYPLVVCANPDADIQVLNAKNRVVTPSELVNFINDFCFEKPILSNAEVEKLAPGLLAGETPA